MNVETEIGYGKSFASFGEIVQGRLSGNHDFLITLPVDLWSICNLTVIPRLGPNVVKCEYSKSKFVALKILDKLGIREGYDITISFKRNIPIGKGLSSSTADMLATLRAFQEVFGFLLRPKSVSNIFAEIEPHDALMYKSSVAYNHRSGELIKDLDYIPEYSIVALDMGGVVDSMEYNQNLSIEQEFLSRYDNLFEKVLDAFNNHDDHRIARCATESLKIFLDRNKGKNELLEKVFNDYKETEALGLLNTHSGTCVGFIFPKEMSAEDLEQKSIEIQKKYGCNTFITETLRLIH